MFMLATRRLVLPSLLILVVFLTVNAAKRAQATRLVNIDNNITIQGRWKEITASYGLPTLPDFISFPAAPQIPSHIIHKASARRASRFNLRIKRLAEEAAEKNRPPELYIPAGVKREEGVPLHQMSGAFRVIALAEKQNAADQARNRQERGKHAVVRKGQRKTAAGG